MMKDEPHVAHKLTIRSRILRMGIVIGGIVLGQLILFWPSFTGQKILLPLDVLQDPGIYLPTSGTNAQPQSQDFFVSDLVFLNEPQRRFAASELHSGRWPMWMPGQFAGAPFIWVKFSPFFLMSCLSESPKVLVWQQLAVSLVAGLGFYVFTRRVLGLGFWPGAVTGWCYPITSTFILWQGYMIPTAVCWLPWLLYAVNCVVVSPGVKTLAWLALATGLVLVSGQLDIAGQVLLATGIFSLWRVSEVHARIWYQSAGLRTLRVLTLGWLFGFLLAAPHLYPLLEYARTGARMVQRSSGTEERPPVGWSELPLMVLPDAYGRTSRDSVRINTAGRIAQQESCAAAYTSVVAVLFMLPLAWCNPARRRRSWFFAFLALLGLSWSLDLPLFVDVLRLPVLNMMSHNRFVFLSAFAILSLAAIGLEELLEGHVGWRRWFLLPLGVLLFLVAWCAYRAFVPGAVLGKLIPETLESGQSFMQIQSLSDLADARGWFARHFLFAGALCALGACAWLWLRFINRKQSVLFVGVVIVLVGDLVWHAQGRSPQCDPALYFPKIPALEETRNLSGRILGCGCFPPLLPTMCGLRDLRGYDAVDPARLMDIMALGSQGMATTEYARTQWLVPNIFPTADGSIRLSPVFDMLGVRCLISRGGVRPGLLPAFQSPDYWVMINSNALPRVFVPTSIEVIEDKSLRLARLGSEEFRPTELAVVEAPVTLPEHCRGSAEIVEETPTRVKISAKMETAGLLVLSDLWDAGWFASVNGTEAPILRANHAVRGVVLSAGESIVEFHYAPRSFKRGLKLAAGAALLLLGEVVLTVVRRKAF